MNTLSRTEQRIVRFLALIDWWVGMGDDGWCNSAIIKAIKKGFGVVGIRASAHLFRAGLITTFALVH